MQLIYIQEDRIVYFQRSGLMPNSQATTTDGISDTLESLLPGKAHKKLDRGMKTCWDVDAFNEGELYICTTCCSASVDLFDDMLPRC